MYNLIRTKKNVFITILLALIITLGLTSCQKTPFYPGEARPEEGGHRLVLYYTAGYNSLKKYITEDIQEITDNYLPLDRNEDNVLLLYIKTDLNSHLIRMHRNLENEAVADTLITYGSEVKATDPRTLYDVLNEVQDLFPDRKYGLIFSSHSSGWLPEGYLRKGESSLNSVQSIRPTSIGEEYYSEKERYEMDLKDFANAIPMHLDFIIFDSCFMGGIEVAYELRYVCDKIGFSPTEILADGFNYKTIISSLFLTPKDYATKICQDYFEQYKSKSGCEKSATISLVKTRKLDKLAQLCMNLNEKYRENFQNLNRNEVQRYFRYNNDYFFDLQHMYTKIGINQSELEELQNIIDECIIYKNATENFMIDSKTDCDGFEIKHYCGLSTYIPADEKRNLNNYYKTLAWNKVTKLVN